VVAKSLRRPEVREACRPLVVGDARVFQHPKFAACIEPLRVVSSFAGDALPDDAITLLDLHNLRPQEVAVGEVSPVSGRAGVEAVVRATELALSGAVDAVATAPLNKEAMRLAGYDFIGHTEILADLTGSDRVTTMLSTPGLRVTHVTRHLPFREIARQVTKERVLRTIEITCEGMRALGFEAPRLVVAALNPHGGEGGLLGREEIDEIGPAVETARGQGVDVNGPFPADFVFFAAVHGDYDVVVCMYHDQGHIPIKTHNFEESITITLGLPIVRTSADHGTAFDIAGRGVADATSMTAAILEAAHIAQGRGATSRE
jgi:4-hydroxythreonine-4-phosphate dehydrogenase